MLDLFALDYSTGFVFGVLAWFVAFGLSMTFRAFQLPGDAS